MARDLLKHAPSIGDVTGADRSHVNETLNAELERYAQAHKVTLGSPSKVGRGLIWGDDPCVWFLPEAREIGGGSREAAERYLKTGRK